MGEGVLDGAPEPTLLIVGTGEPLVDGIAEASERHGLAVEQCTVELCAQSAVAVAPDAVLLVGDAVKDGGTAALGLLSASPLAAAVPVVLLGEEEEIGERLTAFRLGATAVVSRSASVDATAQRLADLVRDIPDRPLAEVGRVGEASLDAFVNAIARELRHGILSVRGVSDGDTGEEIRLVLGEGQGLNDAIRDFVGRVEKLIERTDVVQYEWESGARGRVSLVSELGGGEDAGTASIAGARVLLADDDVARADVIAQELRGAGALVAVVDPQGRGLARARALDPQALVVGDGVVHGPGFELVRTLRGDSRMRWAHMIVVPWDELFGDQARAPALGPLMERIARAVKVERAIHDRIQANESFDVRLEALGAARLLRQVGLEQRNLRLTVWNLRGTVRVDLGQGLVIGARAVVPGKGGGVREGTRALAALLPMASGRARIEHVTSPLATNVMSPVEVALGQAEQEDGTDAPEAPPQTLRAKAGGSMFPVAVAKTDPPPRRTGAAEPAPRATAPAEPEPSPRPPIPRRVRATVVAPIAPPPSAIVIHEPEDDDGVEAVPPAPDEIAVADGPEEDTVADAPALAPRPVPAPPLPIAPALTPVPAPQPIAPAVTPEPMSAPAPAVARPMPATDSALPPLRTVVPARRVPRWAWAGGGGIALAAIVGLAIWASSGEPDEVATAAPAAAAPTDEQPGEPPPVVEPGERPETPAEDPDTDPGQDRTFAEHERPERPHRPPTPLHALPEGGDESFRVPEWLSELGPITRHRRGTQLRVVASRNLRNRRYDRALTWYRRAWWFEENADTAAGIAATFLELDDSAQALIWAQHAVELDADDAGSLVVLGDALRAEGRYGEARVTYQQALELSPRDRAARRKLRTLRRLERLGSRRARAG